MWWFSTSDVYILSSSLFVHTHYYLLNSHSSPPTPSLPHCLCFPKFPDLVRRYTWAAVAVPLRSVSCYRWTVSVQLTTSSLLDLGGWIFVSLPLFLLTESAWWLRTLEIKVNRLGHVGFSFSLKERITWIREKEERTNIQLGANPKRRRVRRW